MYRNDAEAIKAIRANPESFCSIQDPSLSLIRLAAASSSKAKEYVDARIEELLKPVRNKIRATMEDYMWEASILEDPGFLEMLLFEIREVIVSLGESDFLETDAFYSGVIDAFGEVFAHPDAPKITNPRIFEEFSWKTGISLLCFASKRCRSDEEVLQTAIQHSKGRAIAGASINYANDVDYIAGWIRFFPRAFPFLSKELRANARLLRLAAEANPDVVWYATEPLASSKEEMLELVSVSGFALFFMKEEFQKDKAFILAAIDQNPKVYDYLDDCFQSDEEIKAFYEARYKESPWPSKELVDPLPQPRFEKKKP